MNKTVIAALCLLAGASAYGQGKNPLDDTYYRAQFGTGKHVMTDHDFRFGQDYVFGAGKRVSERNSFLLSGSIERYFPEGRTNRRWIGEIDLLHSYNLTGVDSRFQVSTLAGGGFDVLRYENRWHHAGNIQAGLDFRYKLNNYVSFVASPFAKAFVFEEGTSERHFEYGIAAGLQLDLPGSYRRSPTRGLLTTDALSAIDFSFVSAMAGIHEHHMGSDKLKCGPVFGINAGKLITPVSGLMAYVQYGESKNPKNVLYREAEAAVLYRLDVLNMLCGFNENRVVKVAGLAGPGFNTYRTMGTWGLAMNAQAGLDLGLSLTHDIDFVVNPMAEFLHGHLSRGKADEKLMAVFITAGLRYNIANGSFSSDRSVVDRKKSVKMSKYGFNALDYSLQKRYRPGNRRFGRLFHLDQYFIQGMGGSFRITSNPYGLTWDKEVSGGIGRNFGRYNSLILTGTLQRMYRLEDMTRLWSAEVSLLHKYDFTSYIYGYNPDRFLSVSTLIGAGVDLTRWQATYDVVGNAQAGLDFEFRLNRWLSLVADPMVKMYGDNMDRTKRWREFDFACGALGGVRIDFSSMKYRRAPADTSSFFDNAFVSVSGGVQTAMGKKRGNNFRPAYEVTFGKYFTRSVGFKASVFRSSADKAGATIDYAGGRVEGMFDATRLLDSPGPFSIPLSFGAEVGSRDGAYYYVGLTAAAQFRFALSDSYAFFVEPRVSLAPCYRKSTVFEDGLFGANFGLEYRF